MKKFSKINDKKNEIIIVYLVFIKISYKMSLRNLIKIPEGTDSYGNNGLSDLMFAIKCNSDKSNFEVIKLIIQSGVNINEKDKLGAIALMNAIYYFNNGYDVEIIKYLIENGANIGDKDNDAWTPLMYAACYSKNDSHLEIIKYLIEKGGNINDKRKNGMTLLMNIAGFSSNSNNIETIKYLISKGLSVNVKDNDGWTALMCASRNQNIKIIKILIENGANINDKDNNGKTALMYAKHFSNDIEIIKYLENYQKDVSEDLLIKAITKKNVNMIKVLLKYNKKSNTLIDIIKLNNLEFLKLFFECQKQVYNYKDVFEKLIDDNINEDILDFIYHNSE